MCYCLFCNIKPKQMQIQFSQWDIMGFVVFDSIFGKIKYK